MTDNVCLPEEEAAYSEAAQDPALTLQSPDTDPLPCGRTASAVVIEPCDIDSIELGDAKLQKSVCADRSAHLERGLSRRERRALRGGFDVLYEAVVDARQDQPHDNYIDLHVEVGATSVCSSGEHPSIASRRYRPREAVGHSLHVGRLYAPQASADNGWISDFWTGLRIHTCIVDAITCGCRPSGTANVSLKGKVRMYRQDTWELKLGIPAMIRRQRQRSSYRSPGGDTRSTSSSSTQVGNSRVSQSSERRTDVASGHAATTNTTTVTGSTGEGQVVTDTAGLTADGTDDSTTFADAESTSRRPTLTLKHNGNTCPVSRRLNQILAIQQTIQEIYEGIRDAVPRVGWSGSIDCQLLSGSLTAGCELKQRTARRSDSGRVIQVERNYWLEAEITLIMFKFELQFGLEWMFTVGEDRFGGQVTVTGAIQAALKANGRIDTQRTAAIRLTVDPSISLTGTAQFCVGTCVGIQAEVTTGITASGAIRMTQSRPLSCRGTMELNPLVVKVGTIEASQFIHQLNSPYTITEKRDIWSGDLF